MSKDRTSVIVHGGFHKTATTHIQRILKRNENYLSRKGTCYVQHRKTRKYFTVPVQLNCYLNLGVPRRRKISDGALREMTSKFFADVVKDGTERLVLSDENFAGHCGQCVRGGQYYSYRSDFMSVFAREIPFRVSEIHLAIRSPADFFAAAYVEFLRSIRSDTKPFRFVSERQMKKDVLANRPNWNTVLQDVKVALPSARIVVWRYEDHHELAKQILANLCGPNVDIEKLKDPKSVNSRPTASGQAVRRMQEVHRLGGFPELVEKRVSIQQQFSRERGWSRYDPWNKEEREALELWYSADWKKIRQDERIEVLLPNQGLQHGN